MKQVTVLSGKGGTGKTTITAALAQLMGEVVIADCDVEAPNLHLLLSPEVTSTYAISVSLKALIDQDLCTQCGLCREKCRFEAIRDYTVMPYLCEGCGLCERLCPEGAVSMLEREGAEVFLGETDYGPMVWAGLAMGEEASGKVVSQVRMEAQAASAEGGPDMVLIDGSPGIGCPVIASVSGADLALMVSEPTLSGRHDLERAMDMAAFFNVPPLVCVNKSDINPEETWRIKELCLRKGVEVAVEIPFSDALAASAQQARPPLRGLDDSVHRLLVTLHDKIVVELGATRKGA